jgi:outer membrane receptor for ferrienterochelin and colicins
MRFCKTLLLLLLPLLNFAQSSNGQLSGTVRDAQGPLSMVQIWLENTKLGGTTDAHGNYTISAIPQGNYRVVFSLIGYEQRTELISISQETLQVELNISLSEKQDQLQEVVVSGSLREVTKLDSPIPVEVYSKAFLCATPSPSVFESVQYINGVRPQVNCNICNTGDIHINGMEGPYTMVLIDGMPIVSGLSTVYGLMGIPQSMIERVEIVKGPASTLYGSEAVGGLINIITVSPEKAPKWSLESHASSWQEASLDLGTRLKVGERAKSLIGISGYWYQNPQDMNGDGFTDIALQKRISLFNKWSVEMRNGRLLSLGGRLFAENRWGGQMNWTPEYYGGDSIYGESIITRRWELVGAVPLASQENLLLQWSANGHYQRSAYGDMIFDADQLIAFGQLTWNKELNSRHLLLAGMAYRYTYYDDNTVATQIDQSDGAATINKPSAIHLPGIFIQEEWKMDEKTTLLSGIRVEQNSIHGMVYSPRLGFKFKNPIRNQVWRLNMGNGFRVANVFTEDHAALTGAREVVFEEDLLPEQSWNMNVNWVGRRIGQRGQSYGLDVSAFYTYFSNRILPDYDSHPNQIIYKNLIGFAVSRGFSITGDYDNGEGWKMMAGITVQDIFTKENGVRSNPVLTEKMMGVWNVGYTFRKFPVKMDYTGNLVGPMRLPLQGENDPRPEFSPWWSIQNIQITWVKSQVLEAFGGVKNLLNFTPPPYSIARPHDPFNKLVDFNSDGKAMATAENPNAMTFDPSYVFATNQGLRFFLGLRLKID